MGEKKREKIKGSREEEEEKEEEAEEGPNDNQGKE